MIDPAVQTYFQKLKNQSPITVEAKIQSNQQHQTFPEHSELNLGFARQLLQENPNVIKVNLPEIGLPHIEGAPITNEKNPDPQDILSPGLIDMNKVNEYLNLEASNDVKIDVPLFQTIEKVEREPYEQIEIPCDYWGRSKYSTMIEIGLKEVAIGGVASSGFFQLYNQIDANTFLPYSEPLYFDSNRFSQSSMDGLKEAYFFCAEPRATIYLLCFLNQKFGNTALYFPAAVAAKQLFYEDQNGIIRAVDNINVFDSSFINLNQSDIKTKINMLLNPSTIPPDFIFKQQVRVDLQIQFVPCNQYYFTHSWIGDANTQKKLAAVPLDPPFTSPTPIISIFDLEFYLKTPPKEGYLYFKAFIVNDPVKSLTSIQGPQLFNSSKPIKEGEITSFVVQSSGQISFCESIRIYIDKQITSSTYLAVLLYSTNAQGKEPPLYKVGYIPLFNSSNTIEKGPQKFTLHDPKRLPKDLKHQKLPNRTYISCRISLPPAYFPFPCLEKFINTTDINNIELPEGDKDSLIAVVIPIFAKSMSLITEPNLVKLIKFLSQFDKSKLKKIVRSWIYNIYEPNIHPKSATALLISLTTLFGTILNPSAKEDPATAQQRMKLQNFPIKFPNVNTPDQTKPFELVKQLTIQLPIYIDLLIVSMYKCNAKIDVSAFWPFFKKFSSYLTIAYNECPNDDLIACIDSVSTFLFHCMYRCEFQNIANCMFDILRAIHSQRNPKNLAKNSIVTFRFLIRFALTPQFIVGLGTITKKLIIGKSFSPYNKLLSIFFLSIFECLTVDNKEAITMCSRFLKMISFHVEQMPVEVVSHIAYVLFPMIQTVSSNYDSKPIKSCPNAQSSLIPFFLIVFNKTEPEIINLFFSSLAGSIQNQFIMKLTSMFLTIYRSGIENNLYFFIEMTKRILQILHIILNDKMSQPIVKRVIECCKYLLNDYQSPSNFNYFYQLLKRVIEMFKCDRDLITLLLERVRSRLLSKRCLATALLSHQFWCDYLRNKSIVLSSIDTMDSLTAILLNLSSEKIEIYNQFIFAMDQLSATKNNEEFKYAVHERMGAAQVIINVVKDQKTSTYPVEDRCQQIMMIADQYKMFPTMRMKWLQQCLSTNADNEDNISAFISQLHIVALVATVYYHNNYEKQTTTNEVADAGAASKFPFHLSVVQPIRFAMKVNDNVRDTFEFFPEVAEETQIDFASMNPVALDLLNDMSLEMLITELEKAVEIGLKSSLFYSLRPIHSFILRLRHRTRNFKECANSCTKLSEIFTKITTKTATFTHDTPIAAYLVIDKQNNQTKQTVYYTDINVSVSSNRIVNMGDTKIIEILKKDQRREGKVNFCPKHHSIDCKYPGTCVVPLEIDKDIIEDDEHPHHWKHFKTRVSYRDYDSPENPIDFNQTQVNVINVTTKSAIPHYRMCVDVSEEETSIVNRSMMEIIEESMNATLNVCDKISEDLEMWFINEQNVNHDLTNEQLYSGEVDRIITILDEIVKDKKDNFKDNLKRLRQTHKEKADEIAVKTKEALSRIMKVFSRITKDLPSNSNHYMMFSILISKFCKEFELEEIPSSETFESYQDPMTQTFDFEK